MIISNNYLGQIVQQEGWDFLKGGMFSASKWVHTDGRTQKENPHRPAGTIAICHALQRNWRLTVLDISNNDLKGEGAKHIAAALPECK